MTVRAALVGLGWSGRQIWLLRLLATADYEVVAAVDPDPGHRAGFTAVTGRLAVQNLDELDTGEVDLAIVAVPNHAHTRVACDLLRRGVPTFVEKPVCLSSEEADALAEAEQRGGAPLLAGSAACYRGDVAELRTLLPRLGELRAIDLTWLRAGGVPRASGWFTSRALAGGGVLVDLGWHLFDVLEEIVGPVTFRRVGAVISYDHVNEPTASVGWRGDSPSPVLTADVEDTVRGFLVAANGLGVGLSASRNAVKFGGGGLCQGAGARMSTLRVAW